MSGSNIVKKDGLIYQSLSGFYYVWTEDQKQVVTRAKGVFRHQKIKPLVGDRVQIELNLADLQSEARLIEIYPRLREIQRPAIANVDHALIVTSLVEPEFSYNLLDYFLVSVESLGLRPTIILSKYDLLCEAQGAQAAETLVQAIRACYAPADYPVIAWDDSEESRAAFDQRIEAGIYVVMGQSGVGKSTLINQLLPEANIETADISTALNRGRHTTREVTLYPYGEAFIADTPGFSSIAFDYVEKEDLRFYFPEMADFGQHCKFNSCMHLNEPQCAVKEAVAEGKISPSRYQNYQSIYEQIDSRQPIYRRKK